MRPMESDGDHFLTYYLTKDDDAAEEFKESRADLRGIDSLQEEEEVVLISSHPFLSYTLVPQQATEFHFVRDYEVVKVEQEVPNEFLLVFDNGDLTSSATNGLNDDETRRAGAYYKMIERKMLLKKKRTEVRCRLFPQYRILLIMRAVAYRALPRQVGPRACCACTAEPG
jgi:RNA polymerase II-associated factor 1